MGRGMEWRRGEGLVIAESKTKLAPTGTHSAYSDFRAYFEHGCKRMTEVQSNQERVRPYRVAANFR